MKNIVVLGFFIVGMTSCEKETLFEYELRNTSSSLLYVTGMNRVYSNQIKDSVEAGGQLSLAFWSKRGKTLDYYEPKAMFGEDLVITNVTGDTLTKDYQIMDNWQPSIKDTRTSASHTYVLSVADADF